MRPGWHVCVALSIAEKEVRGGGWVSGELHQRHPPSSGLAVCASWGERARQGVGGGGEKGPGLRAHPHPSWWSSPRPSGWAEGAPGWYL